MSYGSIESSRVTDSHEAAIKPLGFLGKLGYGIGLVFDYLGGGAWSGYTLLFMQGIQQMSPQQAGALMMFGQVTGAISTPIVGILVDKFGTKRKWHIFGTVLLLLSFPLLFSICPWCDNTSCWKFIYYAIVILTFQCAFSVVQVTHLAMIPELSAIPKDRSELTAYAQTFSILSIMTVYGVTWGVFHTQESTDDKITPADESKFRVSRVQLNNFDDNLEFAFSTLR